MKYNPLIHHRQSIRLRGYDYTQAGEYFITICTFDRQDLLGRVENGEMRLSDIGRIVWEEWMRTQTVRSNVELDEFVLMPDHLHGIIVLNEERNGELVGANSYSPRLFDQSSMTPFRSPSQTVGAVVRGFKAAATKRTNGLRKTPGLPLWQRNYYEHIIRDENELNRIREYISANPERWALSKETPVETARPCPRKNYTKRSPLE